LRERSGLTRGYYHTIIPFQHKRSTKQAKHETKNKQKAKSCCSLLAYSGFRGYLKGESHSVLISAFCLHDMF
jgi:GH25 family lysozyme M1 (1,4-beta-N-acetylmuramidase)